MRKITFLTLVMILGMSSVSFIVKGISEDDFNPDGTVKRGPPPIGKTYLCISDVGTGLQYKKNKWETEKYLVKRFIVKTNYYENKLLSLNYFGEDDTNYCDQNYPEVKQHFKNGIIKCNYQNGLMGYTMMEFTIDLVEKKFQVYISGMFSRSNSHRSKQIYTGLKRLYRGKFDLDSSGIFIGKCSEI